MNDTPSELPELMDLADGLEARLTKAAALLAVLRASETSQFNDEVMHEYVQIIQDLIQEAREIHGGLWEHIAKKEGQG